MFDISKIIAVVGIAGVGGIIFAESGLFFGFFLPGDSLLFTAGFLASQKIINVWVLVIASFVCAVAGDSVGYWFGKKVGPKIFTKEDSLFFSKKNVQRTKEFYDKYGKKTIILARFVPVVRTFAPILAGVAEMEYRTFITYNIVGGAFWTFGLTFAGYFLGQIIPDVDKYLLPIILIIIFVSFLPVFKHLYDSRKK